jgi:hypothetical protein
MTFGLLGHGREIPIKFYQRLEEKTLSIKINFSKCWMKLMNTYSKQQTLWRVFQLFCWNFEVWAVLRNVNLVDLENAEKCAYSHNRGCPYRRERASQIWDDLFGYSVSSLVTGWDFNCGPGSKEFATKKEKKKFATGDLHLAFCALERRMRGGIHLPSFGSPLKSRPYVDHCAIPAPAPGGRYAVWRYPLFGPVGSPFSAVPARFSNNNPHFCDCSTFFDCSTVVQHDHRLSLSQYHRG